ncbi:uncharacterized protein LOC112570045 [Pomacea canaliculata]|uniref:uncharacterized protein LOC112570045 n=1 Tax=Pomacea canaliculata TaxID=400727 RepID=UPI000D733BD7|nr:uncharacterized protein LOC112570045 [Pomacea canaliculata]
MTILRDDLGLSQTRRNNTVSTDNHDDRRTFVSNVTPAAKHFAAKRVSDSTLVSISLESNGSNKSQADAEVGFRRSGARGRPRCGGVTTFTVLFSICSILVSALHNYLPSQIPSIEKEFGISSTKSGLLVSAIQMGYLSACLFLGHLCKQTHIPRFLAWTVFVFGMAGIVPALVEFAVHPTLPKKSGSSITLVNASSSSEAWRQVSTQSMGLSSSTFKQQLAFNTSIDYIQNSLSSSISSSTREISSSSSSSLSSPSPSISLSSMSPHLPSPRPPPPLPAFSSSQLSSSSGPSRAPASTEILPDGSTHATRSYDTLATEESVTEAVLLSSVDPPESSEVGSLTLSHAASSVNRPQPFSAAPLGLGQSLSFGMTSPDLSSASSNEPDTSATSSRTHSETVTFARLSVTTIKTSFPSFPPSSHPSEVFHSTTNFSRNTHLADLASSTDSLSSGSPPTSQSDHQENITSLSLSPRFSSGTPTLLTSKPQTTSQSDPLLCDPNRGKHPSTDQQGNVNNLLNSPADEDEEEAALGKKNSWIVWLLGICLFIMGAARSAEISLPTHYIDSNLDDKSKTGVLAGVIMTALFFGPPFAMLFGSFTSHLPVDLSDTQITTDDPRWIGAWWLGFLILGVASIAAGIPVCFIPRTTKTVPVNEEKMTSDGTVELLKDLPRSLWRLAKNRVVMLAALALTFASTASIGYMAFATKYLINQFHLPLSRANVVLGVSGVLTALLGTFFGGLLSTRFKLDVMGNLKLGAVNTLVATVAQLLNLFFGCTNQHIVGYGHTLINSSGDDINSTFDIARECSCNTSAVLVSCGDNGQSYLSPCFAGCRNVTESIYGECSEVSGGSLIPGLCDPGCEFFIPYMAVSAVSDVATAQALLPLYVAVIRSVAETDKSLSVALLTFLVTLGGFLPGPIIFGRMVDNACIVWSGSSGDGSCLLYDNELLRYSVKGADLAIKAMTALPIFVAVLWIMRSPDRDVKDDISIDIDSPGTPDKLLEKKIPNLTTRL